MEHSSSPSKGYWTVFMPVVLRATLCNHWNPCIPITRTLDNAHHLWGVDTVYENPLELHYEEVNVKKFKAVLEGFYGGCVKKAW